MWELDTAFSLFIGGQFFGKGLVPTWGRIEANMFRIARKINQWFPKGLVRRHAIRNTLDRIGGFFKDPIAYLR